MRVRINGVNRDATLEEIADFEELAQQRPVSEPTLEERIEDLEKQLAEALSMLSEVKNNAQN